MMSPYLTRCTMIKKEWMRWVTIGLLCFFCLELLSSTNSSKIIDKLYEETDRQKLSMQNDVSKLAKEIEKLIDEKPTSLYHESSRVAEHLRDVLSMGSPLYHFPDLDEDSYNLFISALKEYKDKVAIALYLWSYMVGIPIVVLAHTNSYYESCGHLLPKAAKAERSDMEVILGLKKLCVKIAGQEQLGDKHKHYEVTDAMLYSVILYRKKFLNMSNEREEEENQEMLWPLLAKDLKGHEDLKAAEEQNPLGNLLNFLLRDNSWQNPMFYKKPGFSWGLVRLLQNTAIYLSTRKGKKSITINSPCSREGTTYFGFQDGIFLEMSDCTEDTIALLFGEQFFRRGLFKVHPCDCERCAAALKCTYYPHYTFDMLPLKIHALVTEWREKGYDGENAFAEKFALHILGRKKSLLLSHIIDYISMQQLQTKLSNRSDLSVELFEPRSKVDLSELKGKQSEKDDDDESEDEQLTKIQKFDAALEHFKCREYQKITEIDLSKNGLGDRSAKKLGELLAKNLLPRLKVLDISDNRISENGLKAFIPLLKRDCFKHLIAHGNHFTSLPEHFSEVRKKIVALGWRLHDEL